MTLSLNTVVLLAGQVVLVVATYSAFKGRTDAILGSQQKLIEAQEIRMQTHEVKDDARFGEFQRELTILVSAVNRLVGFNERRQHPR